MSLHFYFEQEKNKERLDRLERIARGPAASDLHTQFLDLQRRHDTLLLITQGIWEMLEKKLQLEEKDLLKLIEEIDLRDGHLDGRARSHRRLWKCEKCGRENNPTFVRCLDCDELRTGTELKEPFKKA